MILNTQSDVIKALSNPQTYGGKDKKVDIIHSHISILFLVGKTVYKLKRAVEYPNVDFSTPEKRKIACINEMKRSTIYAPHLIIGVKSVRRLKSGRIKIGGKTGEEIDTVLVLKRIPQQAILNNMLPDDSFDRFETMDLAEKLSDLHAKAKVYRTKFGVDVLRRTIFANEVILSCFAPTLFDREKLNTLIARSLEILDKQAPLIHFRQKCGRVRKCHGDLLLSNIAYDKKEFLLFSPVEYDETLECIDTLYDLSYLLMDMEAKGLRRLTNILFNHYMAYTNDIEGYPLLPLYQSIRAAFRASVFARLSNLLQDEEKQNAIEMAKKYFDLAVHFLSEHHPVLIACGGLSGSGKSRVAREIGWMIDPAPGSVILRDDVVKKQITGLAPHQQFNKVNDTPVFEKLVYDVLREQAKMALKVGSCVIIDALFYNAAERKAVEKLAKQMNVPFIGFWMDAPLEVRSARVKKRRRNPSDVREVRELESQLTLKTGRIGWHKIMTDASREETIQKVLSVLKNEIQSH